jgi:hypothetical protein
VASKSYQFDRVSSNVRTDCSCLFHQAQFAILTQTIEHEIILDRDPIEKCDVLGTLA